jgi:GTPase SAR1 family protein
MRIAVTDIPGADKFFSIAERNSIDQDLVIFIYPINNHNSFCLLKERITIIKQEKKKKAHYILVGSKADLEDSREVSYDDGQELAFKENFDLFIEVSSKMNFNIDVLFYEAAKILYRNNY